MNSENFTIEIDGDGLALVTWDMPGRSMNVFTQEVMGEFDAMVDEMVADAAVKGVVITSGKTGSFTGGADLKMLSGMFESFEAKKRENPDEAIRELFDGAEGDKVLRSLASYHWIYLSGITLSVIGSGCQALIERLGALKLGGLRIAFDSNYRRPGWPDASAARRQFDRLLPLVDIALPTLDDEQALHGDADATACAARLRAAGAGEVVVKMGADGCLVAGESGTNLVPVPAAVAPVDTTGAGDSFNAAYLAARLAGQAPASAAEAGHRLAARVIGRYGAIIPMEDMDD